jgi:signal transduction histidine kinase
MPQVSQDHIMSGGERDVRGLRRSFPTWRRVSDVTRDKPIIADFLLAVGVAAVSLGVLVGSPERSHGPVSRTAVMLVLLQTLPLAARRRWPLAVLAVVEVASALYLASGPQESVTTSLGVAVALYTIASCTERRLSLRLAGLVAGLNALILLVNIVLGRPQSVASFFVVTALVVGSWSLGDNMRTRRAYLAQLEERARRLAREQEETARRAVEEERTRIARELHDVVAHHISAIAIQASAGAEIAERDPPRAREVLHFIQETSREALAEMRAMLNVLDSRSELGTDRAPQPSLAHVERLLNQSRAAGLPVTLRIEGDVRPLPEALDLSAYRIVQEALTNILKHAGPARGALLIRYTPDALELEISDDGRSPLGVPDGIGVGRGLVGMRERVALFGGELVAGPAEGHGFSVHARLPWGTYEMMRR